MLNITITGLSGEGKNTIARIVADALHDKGLPYSLRDDNIMQPKDVQDQKAAALRCSLIKWNRHIGIEVKQNDTNSDG